ncbi:MAG: 23S rRNA (pseudouridine(1915)-N(3))-methyltransferase RlmH [Erysipelotrichaceae bacterium]|nr:23S rRNA (pseudouridine(1915)-N(3))-methyltransferase RlmH [Erysipelotrichaceae bacterium]
MIRIVCVGKVREKFYLQGIQEYQKRLEGYTKFEIVEVNEQIIPQHNSEAQNEIAKNKEAEALLAKIGNEDIVILLDLHGKSYSSEQMASILSDCFVRGKSRIDFVIAGSLGFGEKMIARADYRWKLSDCTFPHQMVRMILCEQIYRCFKINANEPYHK